MFPQGGAAARGRGAHAAAAAGGACGGGGHAMAGAPAVGGAAGVAARAAGRRHRAARRRRLLPPGPVPQVATRLPVCAVQDVGELLCADPAGEAGVAGWRSRAACFVRFICSMSFDILVGKHAKTT